MEPEREMTLKWTNLGYDNLQLGSFLVRTETALVEEHGGFVAEVIDIMPESDNGGNPYVFRIRQGRIAMSKKDIKDVLAKIGLKRGNRPVLSSWHSEDQGLLELCRDSCNFSGDVEENTVMLGLPRRYDPKPKFQGDPIFYPVGTSPWAILRDVCNQFDDRPECDPQNAIPYDTRNEWSPFFGLSRRIKSRADLCNLKGFSDLDMDEDVPMPFLNFYVHDGCEEDWPEWEEQCTGGNVGSHCTCGEEIFPRYSQWIGPDEPELIALWQELPWPEEIKPCSEPDLPEI